MEVDSDQPRGASPDFDALAAAAYGPEATMVEKDRLFAAAFSLAQWHFIARGELPDIRPYVATNAGIAGGAPMLKAFTDTEKLYAFARDAGLTSAEGGAQILALPVPGIQAALDFYSDQGVTHLHFNADQGSYGFYVLLNQVPAIYRHLRGKGLL